MAAQSGSAERDGATPAQRATFDLERFTLGAPDRVELSGTFSGLGEATGGQPVLVVRADDREVRLPAVAETVSGPPADGRPWQAHFAWQEAPVAFDTAMLALGDNIAVDLPELGATRPRFRRRILEVRLLQSKPAPAEDEPAAADDEASAPAPPAAAALEQLRLEADLLAAEEQVREMTHALERANEELARARADLEIEREHRAADAERYREGLARISGSVEEVVADERSAAAQLRADLATARAAANETCADAERLRARLTTIVEALGQQE
jgi:hypothetical protein